MQTLTKSIFNKVRLELHNFVAKVETRVHDVIFLQWIIWLFLERNLGCGQLMLPQHVILAMLC